MVGILWSRGAMRRLPQGSKSSGIALMQAARIVVLLRLPDRRVRKRTSTCRPSDRSCPRTRTCCRPGGRRRSARRSIGRWRTFSEPRAKVSRSWSTRTFGPPGRRCRRRKGMVLWLRSNLPQYANEILNRARQYYAALKSVTSGRKWRSGRACGSGACRAALREIGCAPGLIVRVCHAIAAISSTMTAVCAASVTDFPQQNGAWPATRHAGQPSGSQPARRRTIATPVLASYSASISSRRQRLRDRDRAVEVVGVGGAEAGNLAARLRPRGRVARVRMRRRRRSRETRGRARRAWRGRWRASACLRRCGRRDR